MASRAQPFTITFPEALPAERRGEHWWLEGDRFRVRLSSLDKVYFPDDGFTKGDLLNYYWNVSGTLLTHVADRPLTLKRMPGGVGDDHFYQKDAPDHTPAWMPRCAIEPEDGEIDEMLMVTRAEHLLFVANLGAIEFHPAHSGCETYDRPDYLVFDLDPFPPAGFEETLRVALLVRLVLERLDLRGYPKTSGATGIQIYVPVATSHSFAETRALTEHLGRLILKADPDLVTMDWSVSSRSGHVFIDHNMNRRGASLAAAYSVRPRAKAPVSAPLSWDEVAGGSIEPESFRMDNILERIDEHGDLFAPVAGAGQDLASTLEELGIEVTEDIETGRVRQRIIPD